MPNDSTGSRINLEKEWHTLDADAVVRALETSPEGLSPKEAKARLARYGRNTLPTKKTASFWRVVLRQIKSPLIYILVIAGGISFLLGELTDAAFIFAVVVINAIIGTIQEYKAEKSAESLQQMIEPTATVRRGGKEAHIAAEEVVPGDIVLLQSGRRVPADCRVIEQRNLGLDESALTGESTTVQKKTRGLAEPELELGDQANMVFAGTSVMSGRSEAVAVGTGMNTQLGQISHAVTQTETEKLPLIKRMDRFIRHLSFALLGGVALLGVISLVRGVSLVDAFFMAVALAVSAIPEGLPVAMTIALAVGVNRMAKARVIVRELPAVEGLGSCTYIASDKTGTLTANAQTARKVALAVGDSFVLADVTGGGYSGEGAVVSQGEAPLDEPAERRMRALANAAVLANEGTLERDDGEWRHDGDPMDVALLALGYKAGAAPGSVRERFPVTAMIPYESERKYAAAFYRDPEGTDQVAMKGALEKVISFCGAASDSGPNGHIDHEKAKQVELDLAERGFRVLAIASGRGAPPDGDGSQDLSDEDIPKMSLLGLVGFIDPLRPEAKDAVAKCRDAGIRVGMITGDHHKTALAIARDLGIAENEEDLATGAELSRLKREDPAGFDDKVRRATVFARINPLQKVEIVTSLVDNGHFVAVTGDGVNDAPALRKANIGIAMGSGNDVAKDTGSIIITDDNFASIVSGIEEGRRAYQNLRKVIYLLVTTGAAEVLLFLLAVGIGTPIPLAAVQLLWLNLVTNGIQHIGLAFEKGESGQMQQPPRSPGEPIFNPLMVQQIAVTGVTMALVAFGVWWWLVSRDASVENARNLVLLLMVLFENFHVFNCRSERQSAFRVPLLTNPVLLGGVLAAFSLHIASMFIPILSETLGTEPVTIREFVVLFSLAATVLIASEIFKLIKSRKGA